MPKTAKSHSEGKCLNEWLSYLESIHSIEIDLGLTRIMQVVERLCINFEFAQVITVAGTNGKGTTCAFLENALFDKGYSVAVYSSPHIERFNERLRINKVDIDDEALIAAFEEIEQSRGDISLTYYEYTTLAAFLVLMAKQPSYIILEVGLGGRLDATNIIDADVAVITAIDLDHQAFLGDTRELIGYEKAGIMRANRPVVLGESEPPVSVLEHAKTINANIMQRQWAFKVDEFKQHWQWQSNGYCFENLSYPHIPLDNVATALMVLIALNIELEAKHVNHIINITRVPGRTEHFDNPCNILLDVGHNPHAVRYLARYLSKRNYKNIHAVVGMLKDKDIKNTLLEMNDIVSHWYIGSLDVPRAASSQEIAQKLKCTVANINCFDNVTQAFKMATKNIEPTDLILVFGSFYTVAEIRKLLVSHH